MAVIALHSASTGLNALSTQIDVIANNLANVNNDGFKASRVNFEDLLYQEKAQPGDRRPTGVYVGLGTRVAGTDLNFMQGSAKITDRPLDMMIEGKGFFGVKIPDDEGPDGIGYTRMGNFFTNADGELVLGNSDGPRIEPLITIPDDAVNVTITSDGRVFVTQPGGTQSEVGQIQLYSFINERGLTPIGRNLYVETEASGDPVTGNPNEDGLGKILQGHLEASNVDPVTELVELIKAQRAFEMNSQSIQAADQALQVVSNLRRF